MNPLESKSFTDEGQSIADQIFTGRDIGLENLCNLLGEMQARVEQLEKRWGVQLEHSAAQPCPYIRSGDEGTSYCALAEQAAPVVKEPPAAAPAGSLVEKVHSCIVGEPECGHMQARAAIREVAAWLRKSDAKLEMGGDAAATADLLEQEAKR